MILNTCIVLLADVMIDSVAETRTRHGMHLLLHQTHFCCTFHHSTCVVYENHTSRVVFPPLCFSKYV